MDKWTNVMSNFDSKQLILLPDQQWLFFLLFIFPFYYFDKKTKTNQNKIEQTALGNTPTTKISHFIFKI